MSRPAPSLLLVLAVAAGAAAQHPISNSTPGIPPGNSLQKSFRPSIVVVIGIFFFMFTVTFALIIYSKFCNSNPSWFLSSDANIHDDEAAEGRNSGIDKAVIEFLPFFRFSALKGSREGLECAVCLSRFEDNEILRLLPRCKHAFHMDCVDRWFDSHSSCPLCRTRVDAEDLAFFKYSASSRSLQRDLLDLPTVHEAVDGPGDGALELYVEREEVGSPTRRFEASFRWLEKLKKGGESLLPRSVKDAAAATAAAPLHNLKHRILVSQVVFRNRWSDFNSADLISLDTEMLREMSTRRLDLAVAEGGEAAVEQEAAAVEQGVSRIRVEMERKRRLESKVNRMGVSPGNINPEAEPEVYSEEYEAGDRKALISPASRSFSDITTVSRHGPTGRRYEEEEERVRQMWLPIARRTVQWFAGKERRPMLQPRSTGRVAD